jgi:hypothetical protein
MSESIIIVLQGGLGNQLFQYAAGLATASILGGELWLTPTQENKHSGADHRQTLYTRGKAIGVDGYPPLNTVFKQQSDAFAVWSPSEYQGYSSVTLKGFYQYLPAVESQISLIRSDLFQSLANIRSNLRQKYRLHNPRQTCFLHVRRGDYVTSPSNTHWNHDESYYLPALQLIKQRMSGPKRWIVVSDDTDWCKQQPWLNIKPFEIVDEPEELNGLMLMSMCEGGAIITNSTFSWWGAILGCGSQGAPVIYPSKWYKDAQPQLFPSSWTRV